MKSSGIYRINLGNDWFYIGSSQDLENRGRRHLADLIAQRHRNSKMQAVYNKYEVYEFLVLSECLVKELLSNEQVLLDAHFTDGKCANLAPTTGSTLGRVVTPEARENMTTARRARGPLTAVALANMSAGQQNRSAETRAKAGAVRRGKKRSAESRARMSASWKLRGPVSVETRARMSAAQQRRWQGNKTS